ncbi:quinone oxidoreductase [Lactiplantibacillus fabifermentans T30PCM01]|uniref:Quinone oxidoreductase n=1 Tax=Lactiplantibacillus fabifermentans T30PCM01 TaxID=1400520 RepID=W6T4D8_9LACO|nr:zinc-binding dehydrogenase [Lactiplantibacillus fabifermentans]ETY72548.1 quinone oxidoreductase [Lactiplantibacillus fabifermentans T30PCM01]
MKAVIVTHPGGPEVLTYTTVPTPAIKPGWTRLKVAGFGINHSEIFTRAGESPSVKFPRILGIEAVGTIDATSAPDQFTVGQTVVTLMGEMGRAFDGSYAEYVLVPNTQVYPITTKLAWTDMAAVPETYYTAFGIFKSLQLQANDRVLIRAVTSGVGIAVLKLIQALPFTVTVTGTTRSAKKTAALQELGLDQVLITTDATQLPAATGEFDKIVDLIGPAATTDSFKHLAEFGILNSTGQLGGQWTLPDFDPITVIPNNRYLTGFYSGDVDGQLIQQLFDYIAEHHVDVTPTKVFTLAETPQAHEYLAQATGFGKVVVRVNA